MSVPVIPPYPVLPLQDDEPAKLLILNDILRKRNKLLEEANARLAAQYRNMHTAYMRMVSQRIQTEKENLDLERKVEMLTTVPKYNKTKTICKVTRN